MTNHSQPREPAIRRSVRLLTAIHELHKQGFQNLAIYASIAPSGMHWRCQLAPGTGLGLRATASMSQAAKQDTSLRTTALLMAGICTLGGRMPSPTRPENWQIRSKIAFLG